MLRGWIPLMFLVIIPCVSKFYILEIVLHFFPSYMRDMVRELYIGRSSSKQ
ncbi:hypothetical protein IC582_006146 [Cucumis melo]